MRGRLRSYTRVGRGREEGELKVGAEYADFIIHSNDLRKVPPHKSPRHASSLPSSSAARSTRLLHSAARSELFVNLLKLRQISVCFAPEFFSSCERLPRFA